LTSSVMGGTKGLEVGDRLDLLVGDPLGVVLGRPLGLALDLVEGGRLTSDPRRTYLETCLAWWLEIQ
jgi:hypothetical protein